jgi:hypothetical protein
MIGSRRLYTPQNQVVEHRIFLLVMFMGNLTRQQFGAYAAMSEQQLDFFSDTGVRVEQGPSTTAGAALALSSPHGLRG